jgi:glycosyltransferase involved in cell wall biosynthesis
MRLPYVANTLEFDFVLDGLVITSAYEGLPIAMIEALTLAVPVFSSDVGDIGVVLEEFGGGMIYPVDAPASEVQEVFGAWFAEREGYRASLAREEAALIERFSSRRIAGQYVDCFERAMDGYRGRIR